MIDFEAVKFDSHDLLALERNIPKFPLNRVMEERFPIDIEIDDWKDNSHSLEIDSSLGLSLDGNSISMDQLYRTLFGFTKHGQKVAYDYESDYFGPSQFDMNTFGQTTGQIKELSNLFPFSFQPKNIRIQSLPHLNRIRYYGLGPADKVVAIKDYDQQSLGRKWQQKGVFRLPAHQIAKADRVLIVEDPLTADYLQANQVCAIALPSEKETEYHDYPSLLSEKELLFCLKDYGNTFSFSLYPLASELLKEDLQVFKVNLYNAVGYESLPSWLQENSVQDLFTALQNNAAQLKASDIPTRIAYNKSRPGQGIDEFNPAQDFHKGSLLYTFNGNKTILSNPLRTFEKQDLPVMEKLRPSHDTAVQGRLDQNIIDQIRRGDYLHSSQLYRFIQNFIKRFIYFEHKPVFDVLTAWVIGTYVHRLFQAYPYLHFMGKRGTGKTTILEILAQLSFNGKHLTKATPASLIHQVHHHSSTLCIDEFEDYSSKRKSEDDLSRFLNGGYHYKGSYEKRSRNDNVVLNTYSPKAFGGTGDIFIDTLKSRAIQIETLEKPASVLKEQFVEFDNQISDDIRLIQLSCFALGLTNTSELFNAVASMPTEIRLPVSNTKLDNRKLQLAKPLLTIAKLIGSPSHEQSILRGLDICWYEEAAKQSQLFETIRDILKAFLEEHDADNKDTVHLKFITKKLLDFDYKQDFEQDYEVLRHKGKFNELLEDRFGIKRVSDYARSTKKRESLYLIPKSLIKKLQANIS